MCSTVVAKWAKFCRDFGKMKNTTSVLCLHGFRNVYCKDHHGELASSKRKRTGSGKVKGNASIDVVSPVENALR